MGLEFNLNFGQLWRNFREFEGSLEGNLVGELMNIFKLWVEIEGRKVTVR